jgi:Flp pilus assembly protein TadG
MLLRTRHADRQPRRAVAAVELAILLPFLAFLFVVAVDFSRLFFFKVTLINCARNGALYASNPNGQSAFTSTQQAALADATNLSSQPQVSSTTGTDADGNPYVEVTVAYTFTSITNFPGVPGSVPLASTIRMRVSQ